MIIIKQKKKLPRPCSRKKAQNKRLWNIKMTVIPIVIGALATIPKT